MAARTFSDRILKPGLGLVIIPRPTDRPTPGQYYQIKKGDNLFKITKQSYNSSSHKLATLINEVQYNRRFWHLVKKEQHLFPKGRIKFTKSFDDPRSQMEAKSKATAGRSDYAMIWIPLKPTN